MNRQFFYIGKFQYCAEYIQYNEDPLNVQQRKFVMLRNFSLMNDVIYDNNIYFIDKDTFDKYYKDIQDNVETNDKIVFPSSTSNNTYSDSLSLFNENMLKEDIIEKKMVYDICGSDFNLIDIKCNLIKLYHPHIITSSDFIVHVENIINNIHFHYICNLYTNFEIGSDTEFRNNNNIYSEYIKIYIPDLTELFDYTLDNKCNCYFKENLDNVSINENNQNIIESCKIVNEQTSEVYIGLPLLTQNFSIVENEYSTPENKIYDREYLNSTNIFENNYMITPLNITVYPYSYLDKTNHIYILNSEFNLGSCSFFKNFNFNVSLNCDVDGSGNISFIAKMIYPGQEYFETTYKEMSFKDAYCYFNNIDESKYPTKESISYDKILEYYKDELDEISAIDQGYFNDENIEILSNQYPNEFPKNNKAEMVEFLKQKRMESFIEEYENEFYASINFFGLKIEISNSSYFEKILFTKTYDFVDQYKQNDMNSIYDCLGNGLYNIVVNGIFNSWQELPDILIGRVIFIDRLTGINITSNTIYITKEQYKYMINNTYLHRLQSLVKINNNQMKEISLTSNKDIDISSVITDIENNIDKYKYETSSQEIIEMLDNIKADIIKGVTDDFNHLEIPGQFNFINNLNCFVQNISQTSSTSSVSQFGSNKQKIIYRPIFYKVNKLQNIQIKQQKIQNIAIDLHEYMSKVEMFSLSIDNNIFYETARNANFVIFNINGNVLQNVSGNYEIYDDNGNYITYGSWSIIK